MKKSILLTLIFGLSLIYLNAQSKSSQKDQFQPTYKTLKSLAESQVFNFVGDVVFDGRTREKLNVDSNTIVVNNTEISGNVVSLKSVNKSIDVTGTVENYKAVFDDDEQYIFIEFNVSTSTQTLGITIEIKRNGNALLTVNSNDNYSISWVGHIK